MDVPRVQKPELSSIPALWGISSPRGSIFSTRRSATVLEIDVSVSFDEFKLTASLSLDAPIAALFGPSGAGKSTVLGIIAGTVTPQHGWVRLGGTVFFDQKSGVRVPAAQRKVGLVGGCLSIYPHKTARDFLDEAFRSARTGHTALTVSEVSRLMQVEDCIDNAYSDLNQLQRQRIALAHVLLASPRLVLIDTIYDEGFPLPMNGLIPFLKRIREVYGIPLLYVSDDLSNILQSSDQLVLMAEGRVLGAGVTAHLVADRLITQSTPLKGLENVLPVTLSAHDWEQGCSIGYYFGTPLVLPLAEHLSIASHTKVIVRSNDIALAKRYIEGISIQNQIRGRVCAVIKSSRHALLQIDCGTTLLVGISLKALFEMKIQEGDSVYCLAKTHAFSYVENMSWIQPEASVQGENSDSSEETDIRVMPVHSTRQH